MNYREVQQVETDTEIQKRWENYRKESFYVGETSWETVMKSVKALSEKIQ